MELKPKYQHDCNRCSFIASLHLFHRVVDLYKSCDKSFGGYIIRYSSEGPDYATTYERDDLPISQRYDCGDAGHLLLSMNQTICQFIEEKVAEIVAAKEMVEKKRQEMLAEYRKRKEQDERTQ